MLVSLLLLLIGQQELRLAIWSKDQIFSKVKVSEIKS